LELVGEGVAGLLLWAVIRVDILQEVEEVPELLLMLG
jgi:hypothetical protein